MGHIEGKGKVLEFSLMTTEEGETRCYPVNSAARTACRLAGLEWLSPRVVRAAGAAGFVIQVSALHHNPQGAVELVSEVLAIRQ